MIVRELFARMGLDLDAQSFAKGQLAVEGIKIGFRLLANAARFATREIVGMVTGTADLADKIDKTHQGIGVTAKALQEITYAAGFAGLSFEDTAKGMGILTRNMKAAKDGTKIAADAFKQAGIQYKDSNGQLRGADDVMTDLADVFAKMPDGATKTALAFELFGKSGVKMIPMLNGGREEMERLRKEAPVMSDATVKAGAQFNDLGEELSITLRGLKDSVVAELLPGLNEFLQSMIAWVKLNKELIKSKIEVVIKALVGAFKLLFKAMNAVFKVLGWIGKNWKLLVSLFTGFIVTLGVMTGAFAALSAASVSAALASAAAWLAAAAPVIALAAIFALVYLVIQDIQTWMNGGDSLMGRWLGNWEYAAKALKMMFHDAIDWMDEKIKAIGRTVKTIGDYLSGQFGEGSGKNKQTRAEFFADPKNRGNVTETSKALSRVGLFDPTVTPGLGVGPSGPSSRAVPRGAVTQTVTVPITINAPNGDATNIAGKVREQIEAGIASMLQAAAEGVK